MGVTHLKCPRRIRGQIMRQPNSPLIWFAIAIFGVLCLPLRADAQVARQARVDIIVSQITSALQKKDARAALSGIDRYKALGGELPLALLAKEVQLSYVLKDYFRASYAMDAYLKRSSPKDGDYPSLIALYPELNANAAPALNLQEEGRALFSDKKYLEAIEPFSAASTQSPGSTEPLRMRGISYAAAGAVDHGVTDFTTALSLSPDDVDLLQLRSYWLTFMHSYPRAIVDIDRAITLGGETYSSLVQSCVTRALSGTQTSRAKDHCFRAVRLDKYPGAAYFGLGLTAFRENDLVLADQYLKKALDTGGGYDAEALYANGVVKLRRGDTSGAEYLRQALERKPHIAEFFRGSGIAP